ncbi:MAG: hypothetical protein ABR953_15125, partial [Candidatus Acidiferrales bacterium]
MVKQTPSEQLDKLVERLLGRPDAPLPRSKAMRPSEAKLVPLLELIGGLRDLPRPDFKARLKADLERRATMATAAGKAVNPIREGFHSITPYLIIP